MTRAAAAPMTAHDRHREFFEELTGVVRASFFTGDEVDGARSLG